MPDKQITIDTAKDLGKVTEVSLSEHNWQIDSLAASPDNKTIAMGGHGMASLFRMADATLCWDSGCIALVDCDTGRINARLPAVGQGNYHVFYPGYSSDGKYLAYHEFASLSIWNAEESSLVLRQPSSYIEWTFARMCSSAESDGLYVANPDEIRIITLSPTEQVSQRTLSVSTGGGLIPRAISPDGHLVVMADSPPSALEEGRISVQEVESGDCLWNRKVPLTGYPYSICFDGRGQLLAIGGEKRITIWDVPTGELAADLRIQREAVTRSLAFSPDHRILAAGLERWEGYYDHAHEDANVWPVRYSILWDWEWGAPLATLPDAGKTLAFTPDGSRLAIAGDESVQIWSVGSS